MILSDDLELFSVKGKDAKKVRVRFEITDAGIVKINGDSVVATSTFSSQPELNFRVIGGDRVYRTGEESTIVFLLPHLVKLLPVVVRQTLTALFLVQLLPELLKTNELKVREAFENFLL